MGCFELNSDYYKSRSLKGLSLALVNDENLKTHTVDYRYGFNGVKLKISLVDYNKGYRFGFNGQELDNELSGKGNSYTAEYWQYDSRLGRRFNVDPVVKY